MSESVPPPDVPPPTTPQSAGRRKRTNPWLAHVKNTMRMNRGVSFKKILKLAKKTFKKAKSRRQSQSQSQSQSAGKRRKQKGGNDGFKLDKLLQQQQQQKGGSGVGGGKEGAATLAGSAAEVV